MSSLPSPSQSPTIGKSSLVPSWAHRSSSSQRPLPLRSMNHWPSWYTPISRHAVAVEVAADGQRAGQAKRQRLRRRPPAPGRGRWAWSSSLDAWPRRSTACGSGYPTVRQRPSAGSSSGLSPRGLPPSTTLRCHVMGIDTARLVHRHVVDRARLRPPASGSTATPAGSPGRTGVHRSGSTRRTAADGGVCSTSSSLKLFSSDAWPGCSEICTIASCAGSLASVLMIASIRGESHVERDAARRAGRVEVVGVASRDALHTRRSCRAAG